MWVMNQTCQLIFCEMMKNRQSIPLEVFPLSKEIKRLLLIHQTNNIKSWNVRKGMSLYFVAMFPSVVGQNFLGLLLEVAIKFWISFGTSWRNMESSQASRPQVPDTLHLWVEVGHKHAHSNLSPNVTESPKKLQLKLEQSVLSLSNYGAYGKN